MSSVKSIQMFCLFFIEGHLIEFFFKTEVWFIYNVVLVSGHIYICDFSGSFPS